MNNSITYTNTASGPTFLAPYRANETAALRYENSITLLNLHGTTETGECYSLMVSHEGGTIRVYWNVSLLEAPAAYKTVRLAYWKKGGWCASFRSDKKAIEFAAGKLEQLRAWAAKRLAA